MMSETNNNSDIKDFKAIARGYLKKWYWFAISVAFCCLVGWFYSVRLTPLYEVKSSIQLNNEAGVSTLVAAGLGGVSDLFGGNAMTEDEVTILTSHDLLSRVSSELGLNRRHFQRVMPTVYIPQYEHFPVEVTPDESTICVDTLRKVLTFSVKSKPSGKTYVEVKAGQISIFSQDGLTLPTTISCRYGTFAITPTAAYPQGETVKTKIQVMSHDHAAEDLRLQLNVAPASKQSQIIEMQMITPNTDQAKLILNTLTTIYNNRAREDNIASTSASANFLSDRLAEIKANLDLTEEKLASYKQGQRLTDLPTDAAVIYEQMLRAEEQMTQQQVGVEMARINLEMVRASAQDNSMLPFHSSNETVGAAIKSYNNLVLQRMQLESGVKGDNSTLRRLDEQITAVRENLIKTMESSLKSNEELLAQRRKVYNQTRNQVSSIPSQEYSYRQIARQQLIEEELYTFLLQKREEASIMMLNVNPKVKVVDKAYALSEDVATSPTMVMALALLFGLLIPPVIFYLQSIILGKKEE